MKIIQYIFQDFPAWNVKNPYTEEDYKVWMAHERKVQPQENITETETGTIIILYRYK